MTDCSLAQPGDIASPASEESDRAVAAAATYLSEGLKVVPVEPGTKSPKIADWPTRAASGEFTAQDFAGMNVGVVLGHVSGDLVDIDLDSRGAIALASAFLPATLTFGRASKRASHWLYRAAGVRSAMLFFAVPAEPGGSVAPRELVEIRSTNASSDVCGHQSVFPGSVHESGEPVEWDDCQHDKPTEIDGGELAWRVARLTVAAAILATYSAGQGRNAQTLGYAGGLLKLGWKADEVRELFDAVRAASGDDRGKDREAVERVIGAFEAGTEVQGFGSLKQDGAVEPRIVDAVERHAMTPEARLRQLRLLGTRPGHRERLFEEARNTDALLEGADLVASFAGPANDTPAGPANDGDPWGGLGARVALEQEPAPLAYVVEGFPFAPGGKVNAIVGPPKGAKTPLAILWSVCVATGRPFLGRRILRKGPVLYLDAETGDLAWHRFRRICRGLELEPGAVSQQLEMRFVEALFSEEYLETLEAYLADTPRVAVVIDTYGAMLAGDIDHNTPQFAHWLKQLGRLGRAARTVIVVLIHRKKGDSTRGKTAALEMIAGSYAAPGAMQAVVTLTPEGDDNDAPIVVSCSRSPGAGFSAFRMGWRDVPAPGAATRGERLATGGAEWGLAAELVEGEPADEKPSARALQLETAIVAYLQQQDGQVPERRILKGVKGYGEPKIKEALWRMVARGTVAITSLAGARTQTFGLPEL